MSMFFLVSIVGNKNQDKKVSCGGALAYNRRDNRSEKVECADVGKMNWDHSPIFASHLNLILSKKNGPGNGPGGSENVQISTIIMKEESYGCITIGYQIGSQLY